jgi:hypothetical protein
MRYPFDVLAEEHISKWRFDDEQNVIAGVSRRPVPCTGLRCTRKTDILYGALFLARIAANDGIAGQRQRRCSERFA